MRILPVLIMLALVLGAHYYVFSRLWFMIPHPLGRLIMLCLGVLALLSPILGMLIGDYLPQQLTVAMQRIGFSWFIIFLYLLMCVAVLDILRLTHLFPIERFFSGSWVGVIGLASLLLVCFTYGYVHYLNKKKVELSLNIHKDSMRVDSLKIVAISDLHLGYGIGKKEFESWLPLINDEHPDLVLIVGDLVDSNTHPLFKQNFAESVKKIQAKYGVYAVLGNHEYIGNEAKSALFLLSADISLLQDSVVLIENSFYIIGRDDRSNPERETIEELLDSVDQSKPIILLDHQPVDLEESARNHIDLQLSGHTHKGQVWPLTWVVNSLFEHAYGYLKKDDTHIYVTSGLGIWGGKFRIGSQSEYVVIKLTFDGVKPPTSAF
ncbi:MAG: metallophosphoesterase [Tannerellaceae bacterium]|jgi:predicted MPP superfamily phosphohydrolase|nr:metallophosphoesterase [Tannerellaceae bacterium]